MNEIKIHDIKGLVNIPDISLYIYMFLWILGCAAFFLIIFLFYKFFQNRNKNVRKQYYQILKELDLSYAKHSAYTITKYSSLLAQTQREKKLVKELVEELEKYKYKKEVEPLNDEIKISFGRFMDIIDV